MRAGTALPTIKTASQQRLEWLESLQRPLTDAESDDLRRALNATYMRDWRLAKAMDEASAAALSEHDRAEADALAKVEAESHMPEVRGDEL